MTSLSGMYLTTIHNHNFITVHHIFHLVGYCKYSCGREQVACYLVQPSIQFVSKCGQRFLQYKHLSTQTQTEYTVWKWTD